ncbi:MAG: carbohydrate-binding domain-containing protein [Tannerellaceae bacterium]|jgi:hypothetical protein|nr:carbohydrate-binding domain-containing protein [Tannerellaceae bacterium]
MKKSVLSLILLAGLLACNRVIDELSDEGIPNTETNGQDKEEPFATHPKDTVFANAVVISYAAAGVSVSNPYDGKGISVATNGGSVTVHSTLSGVTVHYVLTGTHHNGSFRIYSDATFVIGLNGIDLICSDGPAINIQSRHEASLLLVGGTDNRMIDNNLYADDPEDRKATIFSEGGLDFCGTGRLILKGYYKHAICSDDYVRVSGGNIEILSAYKDGIHANELIAVYGGNLCVNAIDDGIECEDGNVEIEGGDISVQTTGDAGYNTEKADISSSAGIRCSGNFSMAKGNLLITSTGVAGKGISIDGDLTVNDGFVHITTTGQQFRYDRDDSSAKGMKAEGNLTVNGGTIRILTSTTGAEGMESKQTLTINDGTIEIDAWDDAINAGSQISLTGGRIYAYSDTNDGIDSNGPLSLAGGTVVASGSTSPEEGIDCDRNTLKITGGTVVSVGGTSSTPTVAVCTQPSVLYGGTASAGQLVHIQSANGAEVFTFKIPRNYTQMTMLFSALGITMGEAYSLCTDGSMAGGTDFHGLYSGGSYASGTPAYSFTVASMLTSLGNPSVGMGGGGRPW